MIAAPQLSADVRRSIVPYTSTIQEKPRLSWDIAEFEELSRTLRLPDVAASATSAAHAIAREVGFSAFHARRSIRALDDVEFPLAPQDVPRGMQAVHQLFREAEPGNRERPLAAANLEASAHLLASLRSLHAATDLLAPVVYFALALNERLERPIDESRLYPGTVRDQLTRQSLNASVSDSLHALLALPAYRFLRALVNTTKHRQLVKAGFTIAFDFTDEPEHGVEIGRFMYDGETYGPKWAADFFGTDFKLIAECVIAVGRSVNDALRREHLPPSAPK